MGQLHTLQLMLHSNQKSYYAVKGPTQQSGYFYVRTIAEHCMLFLVMPFLVVRNHTSLHLSLIITEKKSGV